MAGFGGYSPFPQQFGAASQTNLEAIRRYIAESYGTSLDTEKGTRLGAEIEAEARVFWDLYSLVERVSKCYDPEKMPIELLERWEKILLLPVSPYETEKQRRRKLALKLLAATTPNTLGTIFAYLQELLDPIFVGVDFNTPLTANSYFPGGHTVVGGPVLADGNALPNTISPYTSNLSKFLILLQKPINMSNDEFYSRVGGIYNLLDGFLGWWCSYAWVRDGDNGQGFFLDEPFNLDNQRFRL